MIFWLFVIASFIAIKSVDEPMGPADCWLVAFSVVMGMFAVLSLFASSGDDE